MDDDGDDTGSRVESGALSITNELGGCPVTTLGNFAFYSCTNLTHVTIPSSVTTIGSAVFCGPRALRRPHAAPYRLHPLTPEHINEKQSQK